MWDILTGYHNGTILVNWPDTVLHDKKKKTCPLIDIAKSDDSNGNTKETEKLSSYKNLEIEVSRMWTRIVPVMTGALGTIKKGLDQNLQLLPGHPSAIVLQKVMLMSTAQSIQQVLGWTALISCQDLDLTEDIHLVN